MRNKQIISKQDGVTKEMSSKREKVTRLYTFPTLAVSVQASSHADALKKAKAIIKTKK
ncbi:MAG: hypothetical protein KAS07_02855 [Candidatus Pacebacteria bacterium]|nr:hypothetical protein [Candidatus Paceibacterota bacterium]